MRKVKAQEAIGMVLGHDVTRIIPGQFKGAVFKKGHIVHEDDIPLLLDAGNDYIYVLELQEGELHEDEAGMRLAQAIAGPGITWSPPEEGKVSLRAQWKGLLRIDVPLLTWINSMEDIIISTLHDHTPCQEGMTVAATRVIPLTIAEEKIRAVEDTCKGHTMVDILSYTLQKVGVVVTGNEVYHGRIKDSFDEMLGGKIRDYGATVVEKLLAPDDAEQIANALLQAKDRGAEVLITTGGLSIDPGDVTRMGIQKAGAEVISYGAPILPGAMFLYALLDGIPVLGLPACVFYAKTTIFDLIFPRVLAGETIQREAIIKMGHGGLCMECEVCRFPRCPFGTG
ncbi:MAG: molybdopterin-binding protein [Deltaproteobacteria bacterium RBG_13_52_11]|nr:MAG: molybdopterin-binding protein [Deltaproteobacteria bacterium RBG_13_52_11]